MKSYAKTETNTLVNLSNPTFLLTKVPVNYESITILSLEKKSKCKYHFDNIF